MGGTKMRLFAACMVLFRLSNSERTVTPGWEPVVVPDGEDQGGFGNQTFLPAELNANETFNPDTLRLLNLYNTKGHIWANMNDFVKQICPEWIPCVDREPVQADDNKCCLVCRCDALCRHTRNCCPGVFSNSIVAEPLIDTESVCQRPVMFAYGVTKGKTDDLDITEYQFESSCPPSADQILKDRCAAVPTYGIRNDIIYDFADVIPVSVVSRRSNYLNRHCAACHFINTTEMVFWEPEISCERDIEYTDIKGFEKTVQEREDCGVRFNPPINIDINNTICITDVTSTCNVTGLWEAYTYQAVRYCAALDWVYTVRTFEPEGVDRRRYKNIFCAMCNGEQVVLPNYELCPYDTVGSWGTYSFIGVVNYAVMTDAHIMDNQGASEGQTCGVGEQLEPMKGICKPVICTYPMVLDMVNMECVEIFREFNNAIMKVPFEIKLGEPLSIQQMPTLQRNIVDNLERSYYSGTCGHYALFYKSSIRFEDVNNENMNIGESSINSVIGIAYVMVQRIDRSEMMSPINAYRSFIRKITDGSVHEIANEIPDTFFLPGLNITNPEYANRASEEFSLASEDEFLVVFEDPYDGSVVFGNPNSFDVECINYNTIIDDTYLDCPAVMYDMVEYGIARSTDGIKFSEQNVTVRFDNFRSLNRTHCIICVDVINSIEPSTYLMNNAPSDVSYGIGLVLRIVLHVVLVVNMHVNNIN